MVSPRVREPELKGFYPDQVFRGPKTTRNVAGSPFPNVRFALESDHSIRALAGERQWQLRSKAVIRDSKV